MTETVIQFSEFTIHPSERLVAKNSPQPLELHEVVISTPCCSLLREPGTLISQRTFFMREVWAGIPVTDEAPHAMHSHAA